jgi:hypothetical protein
MTGWAPTRAALGSGSTAQALEASYSSYVASQYRATASAVWQPGAALSQTQVALGISRLVVDASNVPYAILNGTIGAQTGAHLATRGAGGTWTTELISTTQGGSLGIDAAGTLYHVYCATSTVTLRTRPAGGAWSAPSTIYTRPSGYDGMICGDLAVTPAGVVAIPVGRSYWVGSPIYASRYDRGVLSNETGSFVHAVQISNLTSWGPAHELAFDGDGALHSLAGNDYRVRPPAGTFATETLPAGYPAAPDRSLAINPAGALVIGWIGGSGASTLLNLSVRTGAGTWSSDSTALISSVTSAYPELHGLAFDAQGKAHLLLNDGPTYRAIVK